MMWKEVTDTMPVTLQNVLITDGKSVYLAKRIHVGVSRFSEVELGRNITATHWMPLPAPPEKPGEATR
jgi:hypothetical protein